jgi:hypothetical protein
LSLFYNRNGDIEEAEAVGDESEDLEGRGKGRERGVAHASQVLETLVSRPTQKLASKECASADVLPDSDKRLATTNPTKGRAQSGFWKPSTTYD